MVNTADLVIVAWAAQVVVLVALGAHRLGRLWSARDRDGLLDAAMLVLGTALFFASIVVGVLAMGLFSR
jgi:hypothetical protein